MEEKLIEREDMRLAWDGFNLGNWSEVIDVRDFIQQNYKPYEGDEEFLVDSSDKTKSLWKKTSDLIQDEIKNRTINVDLETFSGIDNFKPGYIEKDEELIVGLQSDAPLKRIMNPYGGFRMVKNALDAYGLKMDSAMERDFFEYPIIVRFSVF